ncbi:MAG: hypothetical protein AAF909_04630 [Pseudomonadota bacterium]
MGQFKIMSQPIATTALRLSASLWKRRGVVFVSTAVFLIIVLVFFAFFGSSALFLAALFGVAATIILNMFALVAIGAILQRDRRDLDGFRGLSGDFDTLVNEALLSSAVAATRRDTPRRTEQDLIFVLGNGPSMRGFDFDLLRGRTTIGMNAAYRYWDTINFNPTYYCCLDDQLVDTHHSKIRQMFEQKKAQQFLLHENFFQEHGDILGDPALISREQCIFSLYRQSAHRARIAPLFADPAFLSRAPHYVTTGAYAVRFAAFLGFRRIVLLGIDLKYVEVIDGAVSAGGPRLEMDTTPDSNPNYFFDGYQLAGDKFNVPNPADFDKDLHMNSFRILLDDFKRLGGLAEIVVASSGSRLTEEGLLPYTDVREILGAAA